MQNIFEDAGRRELVSRIGKLDANARPLWGKMNAAQMLAHNSLIFEGALNDTYPTMNPVLRFLVSKMIRGTVIGETPYKKNTRTVPAWVVSDERDLERERARILANIDRVHELGRAHFQGKHNPTFGTLTADEWSRIFCKHLDHHLRQFNV